MKQKKIVQSVSHGGRKNTKAFPLSWSFIVGWGLRSPTLESPLFGKIINKKITAAG